MIEMDWFTLYHIENSDIEWVLIRTLSPGAPDSDELSMQFANDLNVAKTEALLRSFLTSNHDVKQTPNYSKAFDTNYFMGDALDTLHGGKLTIWIAQSKNNQEGALLSSDSLTLDNIDSADVLDDLENYQLPAIERDVYFITEDDFNVASYYPFAVDDVMWVSSGVYDDLENGGWERLSKRIFLPTPDISQEDVDLQKTELILDILTVHKIKWDLWGYSCILIDLATIAPEEVFDKMEFLETSCQYIDSEDRDDICESMVDVACIVGNQQNTDFFNIVDSILNNYPDYQPNYEDLASTLTQFNYSDNNAQWALKHSKALLEQYREHLDDDEREEFENWESTQ